MSNFTEEELKEILQKDSKTLCAIIIANRTLGCYKKEHKQCMIELMKRRAAGDGFKFEDYIKEAVSKNKINLNIPNIKQMKQQVFSSIIENVLNNNFGGTVEEVEDLLTEELGDLLGED